MIGYPPLSGFSLEDPLSGFIGGFLSLACKFVHVCAVAL